MKYSKHPYSSSRPTLGLLEELSVLTVKGLISHDDTVEDIATIYHENFGKTAKYSDISEQLQSLYWEERCRQEDERHTNRENNAIDLF